MTSGENIGTRLVPELIRQIDKDRDRFGISRSEWLRAAIIEKLNQQRIHDQIRQEVTDQIYVISRQAMLEYMKDPEFERKLAAVMGKLLQEMGHDMRRSSDR